jgi:predicted lipoprotein with Yx(FWY)xxD motif
MKHVSIAYVLIASSALLTACGGGGGTSSSPNALPRTAPGAAADPNSVVLQSATINGAPAFITAAQLPVYTFGGDTLANQSACTGSCLALWPPVAPPTGTLPAPWSSFARADNRQQQLSYNGQPLYTFVNDSALTANGDGFQNFQLARPLATPQPQITAPPGNMY